MRHFFHQLVLGNSAAWKKLLGVVLAVGIVFIWLGRVPTDNPNERINRSAPSNGFLAPTFELSSLDGKVFTLEELQGHPIMLNFWATWCTPCRSEMPAMERVWQNYRDQGLVILAINLQETPDRVMGFVEEFGLTFPVLLDRNGFVFSDYQVQLYPTTFFIGKDGVIQDVVFGGPISETTMASKVSDLMKER